MEAEQQLKQCQNCRKQYPQDKIDLHEAYCFRNIKKCTKCDKMIDINQQQAHQLQEHTNKICEVCNQSMPTEDFAAHPDKCPRKPVFCEYCQNNYALIEIQKHKQGCGSRTRACTVCQRFIMIKDVVQHQSRCQRRVEQRRNDVSQDVARIHNRPQHRQSSRQRQISQNVRQKRQTSLNRNQVVIPKNVKIKPSHMIGPETIKPVIDPVPISIRLAMKMKEQQRIPLQSKN